MPGVAITEPPTLRDGDRLTSREFLHRWEAMPELRHAELIDGVVFCMPSPVSRNHGAMHVRAAAWLGAYMEATPGTEAGSDATWVMGAKDAPQPDLYLRVLPELGGQSNDTGDYCGGAPELIVEISVSGLSRDLGAKLQLYRQAGVREYLSVLMNPRQLILR